MDPDWLKGLAGGLLIGTAAALHLLFNGRIAGLTGIIRDVLTLREGEAGRLSAAFLGGAFLAALGFATASGAPDMAIATSPALLALSGVLVGLGAGYGGGCTSGHGVVGISRFSRRSILATLTFMTTTAATVFVVRRLGAWRCGRSSPFSPAPCSGSAWPSRG